MEYNELGKTGLRVSKIGFGASPLGAEFGTIDPNEGRRAVEHAVDSGITYFDVAPYYGRTLAETRLGEFLEGRRNAVVLATKVGRYDKAAFDYSPDRVVRSVDESLKRLRTDHIDIIQVHDVEYGDLEYIISRTIPALIQLKETGKVRFVGVTGYPLTALKRIVERAPVDTVLSYCRYDLLDTSLTTVLAPAAQARGIGLINASPLHMRALTDRGAPEWHPAPQRVREAAAEAARLCREAGASLSHLAMQFALASSEAAVTVVGMSRTAHVDANLSALAASPDEGLLEEVIRVLAPVKNVTWREGRPENDDPGAVERGGR